MRILFALTPFSAYAGTAITAATKAVHTFAASMFSPLADSADKLCRGGFLRLRQKCRFPRSWIAKSCKRKRACAAAPAPDTQNISYEVCYVLTNVFHMITSGQLRAARALVGIDQRAL